MSKQPHKSASRNPLVPPSVVVVSGDGVQCHLLSSLLKHHGVKVLTVQGGEEAFQLLGRARQVDAMVIDWDKPEGSGQRFCELLNHSVAPAFPRVPVIALSSRFDQRSNKDLAASGVAASLTLPIDPQKFLGVIDQLVTSHRSKARIPHVLMAPYDMNHVPSLCNEFQDIGWTAHVATDGQNPRQRVQELCPDLVLLGCSIADGKGLELVDDIKSLHPEIPIFIISDETNPTCLLDAIHHGVEEIIRPPTSASYVQALWVKFLRGGSRNVNSTSEPECVTTTATLEPTSIARVSGEIAHDVNNVLTSILGHAGLLHQRPALKDSVLQSARVIEQAARRGKELTAKLLGVVKPEDERRASVNLREIIREVLDLVQPERHFPIHVECQLKAPDNWVRGDAVKLHQIVLNLVMNACDAMSQGGALTIETQITVVPPGGTPWQHSVPAGRYLEMKVSDTGNGIPEDVLPHIFEVFFTTKSQGSGIGLATVRDVVQDYGGTVTVESQVGHGTTFHVFFPQASGIRGSADFHGVNPDTKHILVVDDERVVGQTAEEILKFLGYRVTVVDQGTTAIDIIRNQPDLIDLVLLDVAMAPMDGPTCFHIIHRDHPAIPVIFSSGYDHHSGIQQLLDEGLAGIVQKPYDIQDLTNVLERAQRGHFSHQSGQISIPATIAEDIA